MNKCDNIYLNEEEVVYTMKKKFFLSFIISSICFSFLFIGVDKFVIGDYMGAVEGKEVDELEEEKEEIEKPDQKIKNEVLVLLLGVDGNNVTQEKGLRTDTMMLGKANFDTGEIDLLSIPRDTRVKVKGKNDKINHAHSYGGPELAIKTVEDFLNVNIDYYVKVDFKGIKEIVDAIGGVELDVPRNMYYQDPVAKPPLRINLKAGLQTLDGQKAHDYLRFRSYPEGDVGRVQAQQYFMKELVKQTLKPSNLFKIDKLIKTYYDYVDTNISLGNMLKYALSAGKLDIENINTTMIPGEGRYIGEGSYWVYDEQATNSLVELIFGDYRR